MFTFLNNTHNFAAALTILLSMTAFAINLPKNLNLDFTLDTCGILDDLPKGKGNRPCIVFTYVTGIVFTAVIGGAG